MATQTTSTAVPTTSAVCTNLYDIPSRDAVCAMPYADNYINMMSECCEDADVVSYYNNCGLYCLAVDQTVADLTDCLYDKGAKWQDVFCRGNTTATATATGAGEIDASASASVISSDSATKTGDSNSDDDDSSSTATPGAAPLTKPQTTTTVLGFAIGALLFSATAFGAIQI
ncbi:uncharacterized protein GGS25DRAFT_306465 [Hypoxylon fragiforme]|uniref:uncharacterized protein n=1 Tax=Hypoxylon fragiforme TaxID=63214 RepID=UPI0020C5BCBB|nr:uncharacterized protein GGS25DRAFT_306465 [Hypoxylon fragiforme]KAI2606799.1 hypothetical protein GGS25DRAFT_306465 [Hypoxylon fragiforme]